ncbi:hypothetical protein [Afifella pfennigii]|uniref:hypothetical protein n=1 Tax=Afifella pfennigii TaxID=209897 RepID=UPI00047EBF70|nr:hypothetical protein [Afifella pfennigii]
MHIHWSNVFHGGTAVLFIGLETATVFLAAAWAIGSLAGLGAIAVELFMGLAGLAALFVTVAFARIVHQGTPFFARQQAPMATREAEAEKLAE